MSGIMNQYCETFYLDDFTVNGKIDKVVFLAALKFIRKMNMTPKCEFSSCANSEDGATLYRARHYTPQILRAFVKKQCTEYHEIINSKPDNAIIITCVPIDRNAIPYMKTNTIFNFHNNSVEVKCSISARLFRNKAMPSIAKGIFQSFAKNKAMSQRKLEMSVYSQLSTDFGQ